MLDNSRKPPAKTVGCFFVVLQFLALYSLSFTRASGAARAQDHQGQPLGSLTTVGEISVNDAVAPRESAIFPGDVLRSSAIGSATFALSGKGSFQIYPNTEIVFIGEPQYAAELKFGKVTMNSLNGATGINLRAGSSVVVAVAEGEQSSSNIEAPSDGSFVVTCVAGSVGVIPLQSGKGIFIRAGQSVGISAQGELAVTSTQAAAPSAAPVSSETVPAARQKHSHTRWILLGVAAAGTGTAIAILSASGSGTPSTISSASLSPSPPSSSTSGSSSNPPAPDPPSSQPAPQPPRPSPPPPGNGCHDHHHDKNCKPQVVLGLAFHF